MDSDMNLYEVEPNRNAEAYRNLQQVPIPGRMYKFLDFIEISEDGALLGCSNLTGRFWSGSLWYFPDAQSAPDPDKCLAAIECETGVCDAKFLIDNHKIVFGEDSGVLQVFELIKPEDQNTFHFTCLASACEHDDSLNSLSLLNGKQRVVSGSFDASIKVWDVNALVSEHTYRPAHAHHVTCVSAHPQECDVFVSSSLDGNALLWDSRKSLPASALLKSSALTSVDWQPLKPEVVLIGSATGEIFTVDIRHPRKALDTLSKFDRPIHKLRFFRGRPELLAACSESSQVMVFDCSGTTPRVMYVDDRHNDFVRGIAWDNKDHSVYTCGWDKQVLHHVLSGVATEMEVNGTDTIGDVSQ